MTESRQTIASAAHQASTTLGFLAHVAAKSPAQIAAANDLKITSNALSIAAAKCQLIMTGNLSFLAEGTKLSLVDIWSCNA